MGNNHHTAEERAGPAGGASVSLYNMTQPCYGLEEIMCTKAVYLSAQGFFCASPSKQRSAVIFVDKEMQLWSIDEEGQGLCLHKCLINSQPIFASAIPTDAERLDLLLIVSSDLAWALVEWDARAEEFVLRAKGSFSDSQGGAVARSGRCLKLQAMHLPRRSSKTAPIKVLLSVWRAGFTCLDINIEAGNNVRTSTSFISTEKVVGENFELSDFLPLSGTQSSSIFDTPLLALLLHRSKATQSHPPTNTSILRIAAIDFSTQSMATGPWKVEGLCSTSFCLLRPHGRDGGVLCVTGTEVLYFGGDSKLRATVALPRPLLSIATMSDESVDVKEQIRRFNFVGATIDGQIGVLELKTTLQEVQYKSKMVLKPSFSLSFQKLSVPKARLPLPFTVHPFVTKRSNVFFWLSVYGPPKIVYLSLADSYTERRHHSSSRSLTSARGNAALSLLDLLPDAEDSAGSVFDVCFVQTSPHAATEIVKCGVGTRGGSSGMLCRGLYGFRTEFLSPTPVTLQAETTVLEFSTAKNSGSYRSHVVLSQKYPVETRLMHVKTTVSRDTGETSGVRGDPVRLPGLVPPGDVCLGMGTLSFDSSLLVQVSMFAVELVKPSVGVVAEWVPLHNNLIDRAVICSNSILVSVGRLLQLITVTVAPSLKLTASKTLQLQADVMAIGTSDPSSELSVVMVALSTGVIQIYSARDLSLMATATAWTDSKVSSKADAPVITSIRLVRMASGDVVVVGGEMGRVWTYTFRSPDLLEQLTLFDVGKSSVSLLAFSAPRTAGNLVAGKIGQDAQCLLAYCQDGNLSVLFEATVADLGNANRQNTCLCCLPVHTKVQFSSIAVFETEEETLFLGVGNSKQLLGFRIPFDLDLRWVCAQVESSPSQLCYHPASHALVAATSSDVIQQLTVYLYETLKDVYSIDLHPGHVVTALDNLECDVGSFTAVASYINTAEACKSYITLYSVAVEREGPGLVTNCSMSPKHLVSHDGIVLNIVVFNGIYLAALVDDNLIIYECYSGEGSPRLLQVSSERIQMPALRIDVSPSMIVEGRAVFRLVCVGEDGWSLFSFAPAVPSLTCIAQKKTGCPVLAGLPTSTGQLFVTTAEPTVKVSIHQIDEATEQASAAETIVALPSTFSCHAVSQASLVNFGASGATRGDGRRVSSGPLPDQRPIYICTASSIIRLSRLTAAEQQVPISHFPFGFLHLIRGGLCNPRSFS